MLVFNKKKCILTWINNKTNTHQPSTHLDRIPPRLLLLHVHCKVRAEVPGPLREIGRVHFEFLETLSMNQVVSVCALMPRNLNVPLKALQHFNCGKVRTYYQSKYLTEIYLLLHNDDDAFLGEFWITFCARKLHLYEIFSFYRCSQFFLLLISWTQFWLRKKRKLTSIWSPHLLHDSRDMDGQLGVGKIILQPRSVTIYYTSTY